MVSVKEVYDFFSEEEKTVVCFLVGAALERGTVSMKYLEQAKTVFDGFSEQQKKVVEYLIDEAKNASETTA